MPSALRWILPIVFPAAALVLQLFLWEYVSRSPWFFFFPAMFASAWFAGFRGALAATGLSAALVWYFFLPPRFSFEVANPAEAIPVLVFGLFGILFGWMQEKISTAHRLAVHREHDLTLIFDTMNEGVALNECVFNEKGEMIDYRVLRVNQAFYSTADFKGRNVIGQLATELYGMSHETIRQFWLEHKERTTVQQSEFTSPISHKVYIISASPFVRNHFVTSFFEISKRKQMEEALQESETRFRTLVESLNEIVYTLDAKGRHTGVFGSWLARAGLTPGNFLGKTTAEILGAEAAAPHNAAIQRALRGEYTVYEWSIPGPEGPAYYQTSLSPIHAGDIVVGIVGVGREITEQKGLEETLERNARIASLGTLAGGIAHDFNNLLAGIFGHIEMAQAASKDNRVTSILARAVGSIERAKRLTGQLLTFARGGVPDLKSGAVLPLAEEALNFALAGSSMRLIVRGAADIWPATFDSAQLSQVLENIAINAKQAALAQGNLELDVENVTLRAGEVPDLDRGEYVRLSIRDYGRGIEPDVLDHIFEPFFTTKTEGNGLGLATAYSIMKRHGGTITVQSLPALGATFSLYLPRGAEPEAAPEVHPQAAEKGKRCRILVMDDQPDLRDLISDALSLMNHDAVPTADGTEAMAAYRQAAASSSPFDAAILDLTIPGGIGGAEVAREIRKTNSIIPILIVSGYASDTDGAMIAESGITAALQKPFTIARLSEVLRKHLPGQG